MKDKIKLYFGLTDTTHDTLIQALIDNAESLQAEFGFNEDLIFYMVVEDFSTWLKSGNGEFDTAQVSDNIMHYSDRLFTMISRSSKVVTF